MPRKATPEEIAAALAVEVPAIQSTAPIWRGVCRYLAFEAGVWPAVAATGGGSEAVKEARIISRRQGYATLALAVAEYDPVVIEREPTRKPAPPRTTRAEIEEAAECGFTRTQAAELLGFRTIDALSYWEYKLCPDGVAWLARGRKKVHNELV